MLDAHARYAPDLDECVLSTLTHLPADTDRMVPSMVGGDRHHGSYHPLNWGARRPHPSLSTYRTPIDRLYLCGSSQHPGGAFTGSPGYNAAGVIAADLGMQPWWRARDGRSVLTPLG